MALFFTERVTFKNRRSQHSFKNRMFFSHSTHISVLFYLHCIEQVNFSCSHFTYQIFIVLSNRYEAVAFLITLKPFFFFQNIVD